MGFTSGANHNIITFAKKGMNSMATQQEVKAAIYSADVQAIRSALNGESPDIQFEESGWTPLFIAVASGHRRSVEAILSMGADPNISVLPLGTALDFANAIGRPNIAAKLVAHVRRENGKLQSESKP